MTVRTLLLVLIAALSAGVPRAWADEDFARLVVLPVQGAEAPYDQTLARMVADEARAIGIDASVKRNADALMELSGTARARTAEDGKGAILDVRWSVRDAQGREIAAFTVQGIAPYKSKDPWEAIDGDTMRWLAATTVRELEYALDAAGPPVAAAKDGAAGISKQPDGKSAAAGRIVYTKVHVAGVTGAPGDGNQALTYALVQMLDQFEVELVPQKVPGAYVIQGKVVTEQKSAQEDSVSIVWRLENAAGKELARIAQSNAVPRGSLAQRWGAVAVYAAEGAADGLLAAMGELGPEPPG